MNFYIKALRGEYPDLQDAFDWECEKWHQGSGEDSLADFLGMPPQILAKVVQDPKFLDTLPKQSSITAIELIAILRAMPPETKVCYDSGQDIDPAGIKFDEEMNWINLVG